jgi:hypothetical protein
LTGTTANGFIFGGSRELFDETKEGGCAITVHADEPRELHEIHKPNGNPENFKRTRKRISINEQSNVTNRTIEKLERKNCFEK